VASAIAAYDLCWSTLDFTGVTDLWDADDERPVYIGEEYHDPVIGWPDLRRHFGRFETRLRSARVASTVIGVKPLAEDLSMALLLVAWEFLTVETDDLHAGHSWVTALLRRRPEGWRFIHYAEAPVFISGDGQQLPDW
jgi:hypothetical protein